jgi:ABC-type Fe3+/spermidine/putrescine transport system ATPase subunit
LKVDELSGDIAVMGSGEGTDRVEVRVGPAIAKGHQLTVAIRPERIRIEPRADGVAHPGSSLSGTVRQIIYLGTLTQYFVTTALGPNLIVSELSGTRTAEIHEGDAVTLSWGLDDASVLQPDGSATGAEPSGDRSDGQTPAR